MDTKKRLGEMLVEGGLITEDQLSKALIDQKKSGLQLGKFLVKEGIVQEEQIVELVCAQLNLNKYHVRKYPLEINLNDVIPADIAAKYEVIPLKKNDFLITVAMINPMDIKSLDAIEVFANKEVATVMCTEQEFNHLYSTIYGSHSKLDDLVDDIQTSNNIAEKVQTSISHSEDVDVKNYEDLVDEAPVVRLVNSILAQAVRDKASDVHISPEKNYVQARFRIDGKLVEVPAPPKNLVIPLISRFKLLADMDIASSRIPQDGRFTMKLKEKEINIRASVLPTIYGENLVLRLLDTSEGIFSLKDLGMEERDRNKISEMIKRPYGMILSTGPTGSGKSTSLYSILKQINTSDVNIITLEDPVEYRMKGIRQVQLNQKAGMTFAGGLRSILRQDPDVIMVGEIRDAETATIAVQAAMTGHRVLSTVHTNDAAGAITRFLDMGIEPFLVATVMLASIAQRLVRRVCPSCKIPYDPPASALKQWGLDKLEKTNFMKGKGCTDCMNTGYKGRTGIYEVLIIDSMVQNLILNRSSSQKITQAAIDAGKLLTLRRDAADKAVKGETTLEEAMSSVVV